MYSMITYVLKQCAQNHGKKTSVYFKLHQLWPQIFSQFLGEASWKKSWGGYVKCPMQSHPWLYRPAADGKQLYWDDCLAKMVFAEPIRDMEWKMYIVFLLCDIFFLESWNGNWLQAPPLQEHFDLVKFWARSKLFHIEKGNDLAFRMLIHNQSNASCCCKPFKIRECAWFLVPAPFCRAVCIPCLSFLVIRILSVSVSKRHLHEACWSISRFHPVHVFFWHVQPQPLWAGQKQPAGSASWLSWSVQRVDPDPKGLGQASKKEVIFSWSGVPGFGILLVWYYSGLGPSMMAGFQRNNGGETCLKGSRRCSC